MDSDDQSSSNQSNDDVDDNEDNYNAGAATTTTTRTTSATSTSALVTRLAHFARSKAQRRALVQQLVAHVTQNHDDRARRVLAESKDVTYSCPASAAAMVQVWTHALRLLVEEEEQEDTDDSTSIIMWKTWQGLVQALQGTESPSCVTQTAKLVSKFKWNNTKAWNTVAEYTKTSVTLVGVALAITCETTLDTTQPSTTTGWIQDVLLPWTVAQGPSITRREYTMVAATLSQPTVDVWASHVSPTLQAKVKSHADKAWPVVEGWMQIVLGNSTATGKKSDKAIDVVTDAWLDLVISPRALWHPSDVKLRHVAQRLIALWAAHHDVTAWATRLLPTTPPALGPVRLDVYQTIVGMAFATAEDAGSMQRLASSLLPLLANHYWKKETKETGKEACIRAGLALITDTSLDDSTVPSIWWSTLASKASDAGLLLQEVITRGWAVDSVPTKTAFEATRIKTTTTAAMLKALGSQAGVTKAWQGLVEAAQTKKAVQIDGLLAIYATLLYTQATGGKVPTFISKIMSAGANKVSEQAATTEKTKTTTSSTHFIWQQSCWESTVPGSSLGGAALAQSIALYLQVPSNGGEGGADEKLLTAAGNTNAAHALVYACLFPGKASCFVRDAITWVCQTCASSAWWVPAATTVVNQWSLKIDERRDAVNATRQARECESSLFTGLVTVHLPTFGMVRDVVCRYVLLHEVKKTPCAPVLSMAPRRLAQALLLCHVGTVPTGSSNGQQRQILIRVTQQALERVKIDASPAYWADVASEILLRISSQKMEDVTPKATVVATSTTLHATALSLLTSLGKIGSLFSPDTDNPEEPDLLGAVVARTLCIQYLAPALASQLTAASNRVQTLTVHELNIYLTPLGTLEVNHESAGSAEKKGVAKKHLTEEEQWELQIKKELAQKKDQSSGDGASSMTGEDQAKIKEQDEQRIQIKDIIVHQYSRIMEGIRAIALADIEVGNACLPTFCASVLRATSRPCPALERLPTLYRQGLSLLVDLSTCVYEFDESVAPTIADALMTACRVSTNINVEHHKQNPTDTFSTASNLVSLPLPSPCDPAAKIFQELDEFHDVLSGASFVFLFPIIRASLMGPRTSPGSESCVSILGLHTELLAGDQADAHVKGIRRDMILSLLELLNHDRYQTFQHPSAIEVLAECFKGGDDDLSAADFAPLLDQNGALGSKTCRVAAMVALHRVASDYPKLLKNNLLVENRIWLNCFATDEDIRAAARGAWRALRADDSEDLPSPSPIYAAPLTPLLACADQSIAEAAAEAYAHAMSYHPNSVGRNIENLCRMYIESYPSANGGSGADDAELNSLSSSKSMANISVPKPVKKTISTGLPKKKTAGKKSALAIAGISKPRAGATKKKPSGAVAALLKPKQERTLDQDELVGQFIGAPPKAHEDKDSPAKVSVRLGVLHALMAVTATTVNVDLDEDTLKQLTSFLMAYGLAELDEKVKSAARDTLRDVVAAKGASEAAIGFLLPQLENILKTGTTDDSSLGSLPIEKVSRDVSASDRRKEGAVVALGSVALHLKGPENESKIDSTVDMLLSALKTPSEDVQSSVADALTKLMKKGNTQARLENIVADLLRDCLYGDSLAVRRGAAYGLAAIVKGSGIATLKKFDVVKKLEESCESGSASGKEGSLFAMELLSKRLGLLFEPYVIVLLPSLLKSFSDGNEYVRKAASNTAGLIMSNLSAHGVKLVMPAVLESFGDSAWRTKQASIQMLGSMSHLAPKQLASALPKVVPKLTEAFSDTHPKVKGSAQEALNEISTVIRNPEIKSVSPILLKALTDPADNTQVALEELIATEFLHAIDAPSLALIVPILHRGLRDRGATVKRMGGLIAGNICTMINDPRDFLPYLPTLLPDLQMSLLDPIPDVRHTSAKALGTLARSLGDHILPELRPWLLHKLRDPNCSSAERSGAAQGLTEVLIASGTEAVDEVLRNELLPLSSYPEASTREGVLWMITFLPPAMGQNFTPYIDVSLRPLVKGLSDDSESVRDVAMRAGRVLIRSHGKIHVDKILPSLEQGLEDDDHRIRLASLSLLGDLLSTIGGTSVLRGDGNTQDDIRKAERAQAQIALVLGPDTRKRVLSRVYMARSDAMHAVRHSAIQIWKTIVSITARALRDILSVLVNLIVDNLASGHDERTVVAGQCLGDVVSKLGESVLPQIIPVLRKSLYEGDTDTKRGVCVGLTEVIKCSSKEQIIRFLEIIVKLVQDALSDDDPNVRAMASSSFQGLYALVGSRAFDEIVPSLMVSLARDDNENAQRQALNGLTGILSVRSRELLPYIIPRLISRPITTNHARALGRIAGVTGPTISSHFPSIIPSILYDLSESEAGDERIEAIRECSNAICASVDTSGVNTLISEIASKCSSDKATIRRESCLMFQATVRERAEKQDFLEQVPIILRELLYRLNDDDKDVLKATNAAFTALSKHVEAEELVKHIEFMRNLLASMVSDARRRKGGVGDGEFLLPGFNIPKGLDPLLPIYQRGILYGSPTIREVSASGLGEVLNLTSAKFLAGPLIVKMTGPLLRIVGDRNPSNVKIAILKTLGLILVKGGPALRAFVPQFQTTFVKALSDPSRQVRVEAIRALSLLMPLSTRVDPLIKELVSGSLGTSLPIEGPGKAAVQTAMLEALAQVLEKGGSKAKLPASVPSALDAAKELVLDSLEPTIRQAAAKALAAACTLVGPDTTSELIKETILDHATDDSNQRHGQACLIRRVLASPVGKDLSALVDDLLAILEERIWQDGSQNVREAALAAWGAVVGRSTSPSASLKAGESFLLTVLKDLRQPLEVHRAAAIGVATALELLEPSERIEALGVRYLDACLTLALQGVQRVQFAFNEVLWLALNVGSGTTENLEKYCGMTVFDNQRSIKSLHSKVLVKIKDLSLLD